MCVCADAHVLVNLFLDPPPQDGGKTTLPGPRLANLDQHLRGKQSYLLACQGQLSTSTSWRCPHGLLQGGRSPGPHFPQATEDAPALANVQVLSVGEPVHRPLPPNL